MKNKILGFIALGLGIIGLASCAGNSNTDEGAIESIPTTTNVEENKEIELSSLDYDFEKEFFYDDYNTRSIADDTRQGIKTFESKDNIVFDAVTYEELISIFESEGNYLILFGGSWCHNTRAAIPFINEYANEYDIDTIYSFDFYLDGTNSSTHIRNTNQTDLSKVTPGVEYNYLYGELVRKYLTNLTDYVEYKTGTQSSLTFTDKENIEVNVAKLQVPFLFLYNKDNTRDNKVGGGTPNSKGTYPIVYGFEEMIDLDENGVYQYSRNVDKKDRQYFTNEYKQRLKGIFDYIKDNNLTISKYGDDKYIRNLYNSKSSSQIFVETDKINLQVITYRQLIWLLERKGNSIILLGGTWCGNTQASIKTINEYAVKNNVKIYNFDTKLDSGYAKKYWGYQNDLHIRDTANSFVRLYTDLVEKYLTNLVTLYDVNASESYKHIEYTNESNQVVKIKKLQVPYLLSYNKDAIDRDGDKAPITSYYEEMLSLDSTKSDYVYSETNYNSIKTNTFNVIDTYLRRVNKAAQNI